MSFRRARFAINGIRLSSGTVDCIFEAMQLRVWLFVPLTLLGLIRGFAEQTTLRGGASTSSSAPTIPQIYAGQDPLKGKAEIMPANSKRSCLPVPVAGWILVYQSQTTCYYFEPFAAPLQGKVVTPQEAGAYQWDRCSAHPWDPSLFICYGTPRPLPGNPITGPGGGGSPPGGAGSGPRLSGGVSANDPCHPYYDMSTAAGRAMAQQNAAQTKQACDEFRCQHNPQLPFCQSLPPTQ